MRISDWSSDVCSSDLQKRGFINASKLFEHMIRARHLELAGRFDVELFDDTVVDAHRIALAAGAHAECLAVHRLAARLRAIDIAVRHPHAAIGAHGLSPGPHSEVDDYLAKCTHVTSLFIQTTER